MRLQKEIAKKLARLLEVKKSHTHEPKRCETCGNFIPVYGTWLAFDLYELNGKIYALQWVLGKEKDLVEDHT